MTQPAEHPQEWLPELALGALDDETAEPVRAHIEGCDECRAEYERMAEVASFLPLAADAPAPEPEARDRLMQRIRTEPRDMSSASRWRRPWLMPAAAAAALVVLVGAGGFFAGRQSADPGGDVAERQEAIVHAAAEGTLEVSRGGEGTARVSLVRDPASPATFALVEGLPALPEGKAYQAWFTPDGETFEPSDVFQEARGGVWLSASQDMGQYAAAAFTIEDEDGAEAPTQDPFVVIPFGATAAATTQGAP